MKIKILFSMLIVGASLVTASPLRASGEEKHHHQHKGEDGHRHKHKHRPKPQAEVRNGISTLPSNLKKIGEEEGVVNSAPVINVDESNFKSIFTSNLQSQSNSTERNTGGFEMEVQGRFLGVKKMGMNNNNFDVNYDGFQDLAIVQLSGGKKVWERKSFVLSGVLSGGYGFKEEKLSVKSKLGSQLSDIVGLHLVPLNASFELRQGLGFLGGTSLLVAPQAGTIWLRQVGSLDGMEQNRWIYFYGLRTGLVFFGPESRSSLSGSRWFDGVTASWTIQKSLGREQKLDTTSIDIGLRLVL